MNLSKHEIKLACAALEYAAGQVSTYYNPKTKTYKCELTRYRNLIKKLSGNKTFKFWWEA